MSRSSCLFGQIKSISAISILFCYLFVGFLIGKLFACSIADVPPFHLNSRNDMRRAYAVRITASPCTLCFFCIWLIPTIVPTVSILHRYLATISMLIQLAVELRHFQQVLVLRFL